MQPRIAKGLSLCGSVGQVASAVLRRKGRSLAIHRVIDKLALPHSYSAPVTTHIMPK